MSFDTLITGGTVVDGTGSPGRRADLGITGDRITAIGDLSSSDAGKTIDASGLMLSPGWIDTHAHSDGALLIDPQHANGLRQGITTEVLDQDGLSYAPLSPENYRMYRRYLAGLLGEPPEDLDMSTMAAFREHYRGAGPNTVCLVPHGPLRISVVGFRDAPIRGAELDRAKDILRQGMADGARGLSTGMSYYPNAYSDTEELIELNKVVAEEGGVYVTHLRDHETDRGYGGGGVTEALEIGRRSGVKVHFSHYRTQPGTAGRSRTLRNALMLRSLPPMGWRPPAPDSLGTVGKRRPSAPPKPRRSSLPQAREALVSPTQGSAPVDRKTYPPSPCTCPPPAPVAQPAERPRPSPDASAAAARAAHRRPTSQRNKP